MKIKYLLFFTFCSFTSLLRGEAGPLIAAKARHQRYCKQHPDAWQGHYNLANIHYKEKAFDEAQISYEQALEKCARPQEQEGIFYNLGNTYYRQFQQTQDAKQQIANLEKSIKFFESTLALNAEAKDAQHNLEIAKKAFEKLKKNQEHQNQEQPQDNPNNTPNGSNENNDSSSEKPDDNKASEKPQDNRTNESAPQQAPTPQQEKSQQEMETLLNSTKGDEKVLPINFSNDSQNLPEDPEVLHDW